MPRLAGVPETDVEVGDQIPDLTFGPTAPQRLGQILDLAPEPDTGGEQFRRVDLLPLHESPNPPIGIVAAVDRLQRLAGPGQVVERTTLLGLTDLPVDERFVLLRHDRLPSRPGRSGPRS